VSCTASVASRAVEQPAANALHLARLAAEGGVNAWVPWVAVAGAILFLAVILLAFGWIWNAIPPLRELWPDPPGRWT